MDVTFRQLEYLIAVADTGTLSGAAAACHVSATAVGAGLDDLEAQLGAQLTVRRRSRGVQLTDAGLAAVEHARELLTGVSGLADAVDDELGRVHGTLRVGCFPTIATWAIPELIEHCLTHHPDLEVVGIEDESAGLTERLRGGDIDVAVLFTAHLLPGNEVIHPLREARPHLLLPAGHRLAGRESAALEELAGEPMALLDLHPVSDILLGVMRQAGIEDSVRWRSPTANVVRNLVGRGLAWTILIGLGTPLYSGEGRRLASVAITDELPANGVVALTRGHRPPRRVMAALEVLRPSGEQA